MFDEMCVCQKHVRYVSSMPNDVSDAEACVACRVVDGFPRGVRESGHEEPTREVVLS